MVSAPPHPPLPPLSPREACLLAAFIAAKFDLFKLAETEKLLPADLLAFTQCGPILAHIEALKSFAETALVLRSLQARTKALDLLEHLASTTDNPIEQRRAASTILGGRGPIGGTPLRAPSEPSGASRRRTPDALNQAPLGTRDSGLGTSPSLSSSPPTSHSPTDEDLAAIESRLARIRGNVPSSSLSPLSTPLSPLPPLITPLSSLPTLHRCAPHE